MVTFTVFPPAVTLNQSLLGVVDVFSVYDKEKNVPYLLLSLAQLGRSDTL